MDDVAQSHDGDGAFSRPVTVAYGDARMTLVEEDKGIVVRLAGEVDLSNTAAIAAALTNTHVEEHHRVVFDLVDVTYLDSAGLALLVEMARRLRLARNEISCIAPLGSITRRVLDLTGLAEVLGVSGAAAQASGGTD
jgi:stage II sporulation protein AA (anti-sigma F factor antagonist)